MASRRVHPAEATHAASARHSQPRPIRLYVVPVCSARLFPFLLDLERTDVASDASTQQAALFNSRRAHSAQRNFPRRNALRSRMAHEWRAVAPNLRAAWRARRRARIAPR